MLNYRDSGVDIDHESMVVKALVEKLTHRRTGSVRMAGNIGHFAGLIKFGEYFLALAVDGVGTKLCIAEELSDWSTVGIDCIAMNVNDLYVMNIEPLAFVDYIAAEKFSTEIMAEIGVGLNNGAIQANIDIVGGETATLKGVVNSLDLAGACLGIQKQEKIITGENIVAGDVIIGVKSSGIHSNGLTLAREAAAMAGGLKSQLPWGKTVGEELLTPTRIYNESLLVTDQCEVHGMCHITGGGLLNLTRLSQKMFDIVYPIPPNDIFHWIEEKGDIESNEMYRTFNMGMGYVYVVPAKSINKVLEMVSGSQIVGYIKEGNGVYLKGQEIQ